MLKGAFTHFFGNEIKSLKRIFGHRCFCLKIILAMLQMTLTMKIIFNETSKLQQNLVQNSDTRGTIISNDLNMAILKSLEILVPQVSEF